MLEIMKQLNCCISLAAAGNPAFRGKILKEKKNGWLR